MLMFPPFVLYGVFVVRVPADDMHVVNMPSLAWINPSHAEMLWATALV
jgi:hypothetical protein